MPPNSAPKPNSAPMISNAKTNHVEPSILMFLFLHKFCEDTIRLESHLRKSSFILFAHFFPGSRRKILLLRQYSSLLQFIGNVAIRLIDLLRRHFLEHRLLSSHCALTALSLTSVSTSCESSTSADVGVPFNGLSSGNQGKLSVVRRAAGSKRMGLYPGLFAWFHSCNFSPGW